MRRALCQSSFPLEHWPFLHHQYFKKCSKLLVRKVNGCVMGFHLIFIACILTSNDNMISGPVFQGFAESAVSDVL